MLEKLQSDECGKKRAEHGALSYQPGHGAGPSPHPGLELELGGRTEHTPPQAFLLVFANGIAPGLTINHP